MVFGLSTLAERCEVEEEVEVDEIEQVVIIRHGVGMVDLPSLRGAAQASHR